MCYLSFFWIIHKKVKWVISPIMLIFINHINFTVDKCLVCKHEIIWLHIYIYIWKYIYDCISRSFNNKISFCPFLNFNKLLLLWTKQFYLFLYQTNFQHLWVLLMPYNQNFASIGEKNLLAISLLNLVIISHKLEYFLRLTNK